MFYQYFLEIKNRLILLFSSWILTSIVCYIYKNSLLFLLIKSNFKLYNMKLFYFITTNLIDVFSVCLQLVSFVSFQFLIILFFYHVISFLTPGLFKFEYNILKFVVKMCWGFFLMSLILMHMYVLPFLWTFFLKLQYNCGLIIFFESKLIEYFYFYKEVYLLLVSIGQIFSGILLNLVLTKKKINFMCKYRKLIYFSFILVSTLITPPDVVSQIFVSMCFVMFYEAVVILVFLNKYT